MEAQIDFRMPEDQDFFSVPGAIHVTRIRVQRHRDFSNSFCMRSVAVIATMLSLSLIASHVIWYTYYFHAWNGTLMDFEQRCPGKVDVGFLSKMTWILIPVEAWILTSAVGGVVWVVEIISKKMRLSDRSRFVLAIIKASILFGAFNVGAYTIHQFTLNKILTYQIDHNTTRHLFEEVTAKLFEMDDENIDPWH